MKYSAIALLCLMLALSGYSGYSAPTALGTELSLLDEAIAQRDKVKALKEQRIAALKRELNGAASDMARYSLCRSLLEEYKVYVCDSALKYGNRCLQLARGMNDQQRAAEAVIGISSVLIYTGMYNEALTSLHSLSKASLSKEMLAKYFFALEQTYINLGMYINDGYYAPQYYYRGELYRDSLLQILSKNDPEYYNAMGRKWIAANEWNHAEQAMLRYLSFQQPGSRQYAIASSSLAHIYKSKGMPDKAEYYYTQAAIADINALVLENEALRKLSVLLLEQGDVERSYRYIRIAQDDAVHYNARLRRIENGETLPIINAAYEKKMEKQRVALRNFLILTSLLSAVLAFALFFIFRQMVALRKARREIEAVNVSLLQLNSSLKEANCIKEEYVGHFLNLCSVYIGKLEKYQKTIYKKASSGQIDEVIVMAKSTQLIDYELKEFYRNFDATFLTIFPDFIAEFNKLITDSEAVTPKKDELLSPELRIFALIRLGIHDSSQIAKFLRYSVNTVYTYRTKVKNKARIFRGDFEDEVMKIGGFS